MKLSLHIGLGKTGTTALQSFLQHEPDALRNSRIGNTGVLLGNLGGDFALASLDAVKNPQTLRSGLKAVERWTERSQGIDHFVWCNEALSMNVNAVETAGIVAEFAQASRIFDMVEIVLVLRRQDEWIEAGYRQWGLKHKVYPGRHIKSPEEYVEGARRHLDYLDTYRNWSRVGPGNVRVMPYDDILDSGGIVPHFCRFWNIPWQDGFDAYGKVHKSLGAAKSHFIATYNRGFQREVLPREFLPVMRDSQLPDLDQGDVVFIPEDLRRQVLADYAESNRAVAEQALGRAELFGDRPVKRPAPYVSGIQDSLTYLTMIAKSQHDRILQLTERLEAQQQEIDRLKAQQG